jgi:hypothetical protein
MLEVVACFLNFCSSATSDLSDLKWGLAVLKRNVYFLLTGAL